MLFWVVFLLLLLLLFVLNISLIRSFRWLVLWGASWEPAANAGKMIALLIVRLRINNANNIRAGIIWLLSSVIFDACKQELNAIVSGQTPYLLGTEMEFTAVAQ